MDLDTAFKIGGFGVAVYLLLRIISLFDKMIDTRAETEKENAKASAELAAQRDLNFKERDRSLDDLIRMVNETHTQTLSIQKQGFESNFQSIKMIVEELKTMTGQLEKLYQVSNDHKGISDAILQGILDVPARSRNLLRPDLQGIQGAMSDRIDLIMDNIAAIAAHLNVPLPPVSDPAPAPAA